VIIVQATAANHFGITATRRRRQLVTDQVRERRLPGEIAR
jgi:hypothetical protein